MFKINHRHASVKQLGIQEDHHLYILEIFLAIPSQMSSLIDFTTYCKFLFSVFFCHFLCILWFFCLFRFLLVFKWIWYSLLYMYRESHHKINVKFVMESSAWMYRNKFPHHKCQDSTYLSLPLWISGIYGSHRWPRCFRLHFLFLSFGFCNLIFSFYISSLRLAIWFSFTNSRWPSTDTAGSHGWPKTLSISTYLMRFLMLRRKTQE